MPPNREKKRDHSRNHLRFFLSAIMLSISMITPPEMQDTIFLSSVMRYPVLKEPNVARMAPEAMTPMSLVSLPENFFYIFSILSALTVAKTIQPNAPRAWSIRHWQKRARSWDPCRE